MKISLRAARVNAGFIQSEAAEILGVSKPTIIRWERGESLPNIRQFQQMCVLYGCTPEELNILDIRDDIQK